MKPDQMFTRIRAENTNSGEYVDISELSTPTLVEELERVSDLLDDLDLHNHNLQTEADLGWFDLRELLDTAAERLKE